MVNCIVNDVSNLVTGAEPLNFTYTYTDFYGGFSMPSGTGNISQNPLFVDAANGDYHLQNTSPCIDSGTATDAPNTDFEGTSRPQHSGHDMGAYEFSGALAVNYFHPFLAKMENGKVHLHWSTAVESDNKFFQIERSQNISDWTKIGRVSGKDDYNHIQYYDVIDDFPPRGIVYYRLKQVDFNGSFSYSNVADIYVRKPDIQLYPNPASDYIFITSDVRIDKIHIYDQRGRLVMSQKSNTEEMDISSILPGFYVVKIWNNGGILIKEVVIE